MLYGRGGAIDAQNYGVTTRGAAPRGTHTLGDLAVYSGYRSQSDGERGGELVLEDPQWWDGCIA